MEVFKFVGIGICAAAIAIILRQSKPEYAMQISVCAGLLIFSLIIPALNSVISLADDIALKTGIDFKYLSPIVKITGIAYIAQFGAEVCRDAGETAIAAKVEMGGKLLILALAAPVIGGLLSVLAQMIP